MPEKSKYTLNCPGNAQLNTVRMIPKSINEIEHSRIGFKGETANLTTYNKVQYVVFKGKKYTYEYILRFGGGRGYVKVSKN